MTRPKAPFRPSDIYLWPLAIAAATIIEISDLVRRLIPGLRKVEIPAID